MKPNVGNTDRALRIIAGLVLLAMFFVLPGAWRWAALIGFVPLATGLVRWCPAYTLFRTDTCGQAGGRT